MAASREASAGGGLAVDATGRVHACFDDYATGAVFYAVRDGGGVWSVEPLAERTPPASDALDCALALDSTDRPHVAYTASSGGMWHGVRDGAWTRTRVDPASSSAVSIAVDAADRPHIAYVASASSGAEVRHAALR